MRDVPRKEARMGLDRCGEKVGFDGIEADGRGEIEFVRSAGDVEEAEARFVGGAENEIEMRGGNGADDGGFDDESLERGDRRPRLRNRLVERDGKVGDFGKTDELFKGAHRLFEVVEIGRFEMAGERESLGQSPGAVRIEAEAIGRVSLNESHCVFGREVAHFEFEGGAVGLGGVKGGEGEMDGAERFLRAGDAPFDGRKRCPGKIGENFQNFGFGLFKGLAAESGKWSDFAKGVATLEDQSFARGKRILI